MRNATRSRLPVVATAAALAATAFVAVGPTPSVSAATLTVDTLSDNPADGYTLREAISDANANVGLDIIDFAAGLTGTITLASGELAVSDSVEIQGPGSDALAIDGNGLSRVINVTGAGIGFVMHGLAVSGGATLGSGGGIAFGGGDHIILDDVNLVGNSAAGQGGGLWVANPGDVVEISDSHFDTNTSGESGGGIFVSGAVSGHVGFENVLIENNESVNGDGGGIVVDKPSSTITLTEVDVIDNEAPNATAGGMSLNGGWVRISNTTIADNRAGTSSGGARINSNSIDVEITASTFAGNAAANAGAGQISSERDLFVTDTTFENNSSDGLGGVELNAAGDEVNITSSRFVGNVGGTTGALDVVGADLLHIVNSTLDANTGTDHGALAVNASLANIEQSTISHNEADPLAGLGGGIYAFGGTRVVAFNSTFDGNSAFDGGAIFSRAGGEVILIHTTMVANTAINEGGGVHAVGGADIYLDSSIVSDNVAPTHPDVSDATLQIRYSILGDSSGLVLNGSNNQVGTDPKLGVLDDNGGPTLTRMPMLDSPAIDNASSVVNFGDPYPDQRGVIRNPETTDIGSVEVVADPVDEPSDNDAPVDGEPIWVPTEPARFVDTRTNGETIDDQFEATGALEEGEQRQIVFAGRGDVPADAVGVIANITAIKPLGNGFVTAHPCVIPRPNAASLNYTTGVNLGNEVILGLDDGDACIYTSASSHITVDVVGYITSESGYEAIEPARYADTRADGETFDGLFEADGRPSAGGQMSVNVKVRGSVGVSATSVVLYVAAVRPDKTGFVTAWACGTDRPLASSLNHVSGVNRGNEVIVNIGVDGDVCFYTSADVDLTVDVVGFIATGTNYESLDAPSRFLDTRDGGETVDGLSEADGAAGSGESIEVQVAGRAGIPGAVATVSVNVTAVNPSAAGFITVYDCITQPLASSLNYVSGVNGGNEIIAEVNANGRMCLFTSAATHLTADITGYTSL